MCIRDSVCTTDAEKGNLRPICDQEGYKSFVIPAGVGGRFSELTPVGLLPAAMTGIDIKELLAGAAFMDEQCKEEDTYRNIGHMYGILSYLAMKQGKNIQVMMPYADSLKYMADWFAQLWACLLYTSPSPPYGSIPNLVFGYFLNPKFSQSICSKFCTAPHSTCVAHNLSLCLLYTSYASITTTQKRTMMENGCFLM